MTKVEAYRAARYLNRKYNIGASLIARYLGITRGTAQQWIKDKPTRKLEDRSYNQREVERIVLRVRSQYTFDNLDYYIGIRLRRDYKLTSSLIAKVLGKSVATMTSWHNGRGPSCRGEMVVEIIVERKYEGVVKRLTKKVTDKCMPYLLTRKMCESKEIGSRLISDILRETFMRKFPERTISSWVTDERKPHMYHPDLVDEVEVLRRLEVIKKGLTHKHIDYHCAMRLYKKGWKYRSIALLLELDIELVRGWVKKGRGPKIAKLLYNENIIRTAVEKLMRVKSEDEFT